MEDSSLEATHAAEEEPMLHRLPVEALMQVLSWLDPIDLSAVAQVNKVCMALPSACVWQKNRKRKIVSLFGESHLFRN